mgnify:CR=1 FL=1
MSWKKDNPGSPCCSCCPCYPLDGNGKSNPGPLELTATNPAYAAGVMGQAAQFTGTTHYEQAHNDCFSPSEHTTWRLWFWFKKVTEPTDEPHQYHGVITKGAVNQPSGSPLPAPSIDGEWAVVYKPATASGEDVNFVYKSDIATFGVLGGSAIDVGKWYFFHWLINHTTKNCEITGYKEGSSTPFVVCHPTGCTSTPNISGNMSKTSEPLRIGNNTGTNGVILGSNSGSFLIDNVGFSDRTGTASNLYNSGSGKPCPNIGG